MGESGGAPLAYAHGLGVNCESGVAALTHLHVLRREPGKGLQREVALVALFPLHALVLSRSAPFQPQVAYELLHLPGGGAARLSPTL